MSRSGLKGKDVPSDRAKRYATIRYGNPGMSKKDCAVAAGYSPKTSTQYVDKSKGVRAAIATVEQQRELIRSSAGFTLEDIAKRVKGRATNDDVPFGVQTDNDKILISILGYNAPEEININQKALFMEFKDLSAVELRGLLGRYGEGEGSSEVT
jgi:hypothetical protein